MGLKAISNLMFKTELLVLLSHHQLLSSMSQKWQFCNAQMKKKKNKKQRDILNFSFISYKFDKSANTVSPPSSLITLSTFTFSFLLQITIISHLDYFRNFLTGLSSVSALLSRTAKTILLKFKADHVTLLLISLL